MAALYKTFFGKFGIFSYPGLLEISEYDQFGDSKGNGLLIREKFFNLIPQFYESVINAFKEGDNIKEEYFNELIMSFLNGKMTIKR